MSNITADCHGFNMGSSQQSSTRIYLRRVNFADYDTIETLNDDDNRPDFYPDGKEGAVYFYTFEQLGVNGAGFLSNWDILD